MILKSLSCPLREALKLIIVLVVVTKVVSQFTSHHQLLEESIIACFVLVFTLKKGWLSVSSKEAK